MTKKTITLEEQQATTNATEIEEFIKQMREMVRETYEHNNNDKKQNQEDLPDNFNNNNNENSNKHATVVNMLVNLLNRELEELGREQQADYVHEELLQTTNHNDGIPTVPLLQPQQFLRYVHQQQEQQKAIPATYPEFLSDLQSIQESYNKTITATTDENNNHDHSTYSIVGNAELEMEKESRYPQMHLPTHHQDSPGATNFTTTTRNRSLFEQVRKNMRSKL